MILFYSFLSFEFCDYCLFQKLHKYNEKLKYFHIINELNKQMTKEKMFIISMINIKCFNIHKAI